MQKQVHREYKTPQIRTLYRNQEIKTPQTKRRFTVSASYFADVAQCDTWCFGHLSTLGTLPPSLYPWVDILCPYLSTDGAGDLHPVLLMQLHVSFDVFGHLATLRTLLPLVLSPLGRHLHDLFPPFRIPHLLLIVCLVLVLSFDVFHKSCTMSDC